MNVKITNILVATDFSEPSLNALHTAAALAAKVSASLFIIHVHETLAEYSGSQYANTDVPTKNSNVLAALEADISSKTKTKPIVLSEKGHVTEMIIKKAVQHKCGLIVMGTYGASGYRDGFVGTNAYNVIKFAPCPVLLIPTGRKWVSFKNPLLPLRPSITTLRHYDIVGNFIAPGSTLQILGLSPSGPDGPSVELNKVVEEMKKKLGIENIVPNTRLNHDTPVPENVLFQAERNNSDLIIVTPSIDLSTKQYYIGANAHRIIHHSRIPLLAINKQIERKNPATDNFGPDNATHQFN